MATFWTKLFSRTESEGGQYELAPGSGIAAYAAPSNYSRRRITKIIILLSSMCVFLMFMAGGVITDHPVKAHALAAISSAGDRWRVGKGNSGPAQPIVGPEGLVLDPRFYLKGSAGGRFRDALRPDLKYMTTFHYAGMSNDVQQFCNLIYLAMTSRRIPVIPPLDPATSHVGLNAFSRNFGEIFDVRRLSALLNYPILEWADIKRARYSQLREYNLPPLEGVEIEDIGCWSLWQAFDKGHRPVNSGLAKEFLYLNITWSPVPEFVRMTTKQDDYFGSMSGLARLVLPETRRDVLKSPQMANVSIVPDDQLACFDLLYYTGVRQAWEWDGAVPAVWDLVGTNLHYAPKIETLADEYLRRLFNVPEDSIEGVPPFISIHIRRSDFKKGCPKDKPIEDCMQPLSAYEERLNQVHQDIIQIFGADSPQASASRNVIVSSDEDDPAWWASVKAKGWLMIDHEKENTAEKHGSWYLTVIDSQIHSQATGFVGTQGSTFSVLSAKRVHDWNGGPSRMVDRRQH